MDQVPVGHLSDVVVGRCLPEDAGRARAGHSGHRGDGGPDGGHLADGCIRAGVTDSQGSIEPDGPPVRADELALRAVDGPGGGDNAGTGRRQDREPARVAELRMQRPQLVGREGGPVDIQRTDHAAELPESDKPPFGAGDRARIAPDRFPEPHDHGRGVSVSGGEVGSEQGISRGRIGASGGGRGRAEPARPVAGGCRGQHAKDQEPEAERRGRVGNDPARRTSPPAQAASALGRIRWPERGPAEDGQQGRQQGEPGKQHQCDGDGQRSAEAGVQPEAGQQERKQRGDDGRGGERDRFADPAKGAGDRIMRSSAGPELLPYPEDKEQAIVRSRTEGQHKDQDLGERRYLQPSLARLRDRRPGELGD